MSFRAMFVLASVMFSVMIAAPLAMAQPGVHTAKTGSEVLRLIRNEKLELILPGAMRDNNVDMWIHVTRAGDPDPMYPEFGSTSGYLVFTDLGDRIERASFNGYFLGSGAVENIDVQGSEAIKRAITGYDDSTQDLSAYDELTTFVAERDPQTIAVNYSDWLAIADGISHTQFVKLEKILGSKYSERMVSAENLITDFRSRRTLREVALMVNAVELHRQIQERALSNEVITPGVTTLEDVGWWVREQFFRRAHVEARSSSLPATSMPGVTYSAVSDRSETRSPQYVIQRGDFLSFDIGLRYLDYFETDFKRKAYVMREGETSVPASLQHAFDRAVAAQKIIRKQIKVGKTARQTLQDIIAAMEAADYIYTPYNDEGGKDYKNVQEKLANTHKSGFSLDLHSQGNHGGSLVTVGPSIAEFRSDRDHLTVQENHIFSFEYVIGTNLPERPGFPLTLNMEDNHVVSSRGVEFLHPPNERILLIH